MSLPTMNDHFLEKHHWFSPKISSRSFGSTSSALPTFCESVRFGPQPSFGSHSIYIHTKYIPCTHDIHTIYIPDTYHIHISISTWIGQKFGLVAAVKILSFDSFRGHRTATAFEAVFLGVGNGFYKVLQFCNICQHHEKSVTEMDKTWIKHGQLITWIWSYSILGQWKPQLSSSHRALVLFFWIHQGSGFFAQFSVDVSPVTV